MSFFAIYFFNNHLFSNFILFLVRFVIYSAWSHHQSHHLLSFMNSFLPSNLKILAIISSKLFCYTLFSLTSEIPIKYMLDKLKFSYLRIPFSFSNFSLSALVWIGSISVLFSFFFFCNMYPVAYDFKCYLHRKCPCTA